MPSRCLIVVNYRSSALTRDAARSAVLASSGQLRILVIDNSEDDDEYRSLRTLAGVEVVQASRNLGYAGAINLGLSRSDEELVIAANPDVVFRPESIDRLAAALTGSAALAGPACTWDDEDRWLLPLPRAGTRSERLREVLASRSGFFHASEARRAIRERVAVWRASEPLDVPAVSGAVMALRRKAVAAIGGMDERFAMYFEEVDLMRRLRASGCRIRYVPEALCQHYFAQTGGEQNRDLLFAESQKKFDEKWLGGRFSRAAARLRIPPSDPNTIPPMAIDMPLLVPDPVEDHLVEASPLASFESAAGHFPAARTVWFPRDVHARLRSPELFLRVIDLRAGRVVTIRRLVQSVQ